jgi:hypothetical protein
LTQTLRGYWLGMSENDLNNDEGMAENDYKPGNPYDEPRDSGDQANDIRFSEEEQLIREQAHGNMPQKDDVPRDMSNVDQAMAGIDVPDADIKGGDASDDPAHYGEEQ